ncbi:Fumarate reductase subunit C [Vibrio aerogenes CECT 7868]|uniref:Fumarate reductase subunit C n=1 Tax=Vibrio aerogenes CECT 7868 TaxID=1216006 RepID=A0A1M6CDN5_9VIBR|nr:fumarate reductase subunit FrdC [Vibrio aerogenes]SHI59129.1 Fumarate reductase subunit C [Vibrio aerogenes CECT 7868]
MSHRKPYIREVKRTWWKSLSFYRFYMLREATVLPLIFFTLCLLFGLISLVKGPESWQHWLNFMSSPIVIILNMIALLGSLFHAQTFFSMLPQVVPVRIKGKLLNKKIIVLGQWAATLVISLVILALV